MAAAQRRGEVESDVTRVGFCGAGRVARLHANGFRRSGAEVAAFADPRAGAAEAVACEYGAAAYATPEAMISAEALDVLCIATPHDLHAAQAHLGFSAGLDVFMDKPMALSVAEGEALIAAAQAAGQRLGVNHNLLFHPVVLGARKLIGEGAIGSAVSANAWSLGWLNIPPWDFRLDRGRTGGGAWTDAGPHLVYTLAELLGPFERLSAMPAGTPSRLGGEDTVVGIGRSESGAVFSLRISYAYVYVAPNSTLDWPNAWRQGMEINGTEGAIRFEVSPVGRLEHSLRGEERWRTLRDDLLFSDSFDGAIADFIAAREGGRHATGDGRGLAAHPPLDEQRDGLRAERG